MNIGANIKKFRYEKGWRQEDLARESGVSQGMISMMERGLSHGAPASWQKLSSALGVSIAELRKGADAGGNRADKAN